MSKIVLKKQDEPRFDELSRMLADLNAFLDGEADFNDAAWNANLDAILDFQDDDGSFKLFNSFDIPSDARVDFCYMPTYICSSILMKACLTDSSSFGDERKSALSRGLKMSCARNLRGHGYEALKSQIEALNIFMKAGLNEFLDLYPDLCPEFSEMIERIASRFHEMETDGKFTGQWGESYEAEIRAVNRYFRQRKVFVYGTLMKGEANHKYLEGSKYLGKATIRGYEMYDVGWYPAIVAGDSLIVGELYQVSIGDMPSIDMLEGEGHLYDKTCETVTDAEGNTIFALVYVYKRECSGLKRIPAWGKEYVWYVSYGSNMLSERFMQYIEGGSYEGSRYHPPCKDKTPPVAVKPINIPYGMYFGNESGSWDGGGVSFLDMTSKGRALGVAYLITKEQFDHVVYEENAGRRQNPDYVWYEDTIDLEAIDGFEVRTITNKYLRPYRQPVSKYLDTLRKGIRQNWPHMTDEEIEDYLDSCIR